MYCGFTLHGVLRVVMLWFHTSISAPEGVCLLRRKEKEDFFGWFSFIIVIPKVGARTAGLGSGAIAGIVIAVILIVLITIDLFCCFFNSCGIIFCCHRAICGVDGGVTGGKDDCEYDCLID